MRKRIISITVAMILLISPNIYAMDTDQAGEQLKVMMDFIMDNYVGSEVSEEDLYNAALKGIFNELDPYSEVYNLEEYEEFMQNVSGNYSGIGAYITEIEDYIMITEPMKGSPAEKAGILAGDIIVRIDGKDLKDIPYDIGINMILGEAGTTVTLTIKRGQEVFDVDVIRDEIQVKAASYVPLAELYPNETDKDVPFIWYVDIDSFNGTVANDFKDILDAANEEGIKGLIIDLRNNTGGYLDQVINMCQMIIPKGTIVSTVDKYGRETVYSSSLEKAPYKIVVLTNEYTASASEIFASAIKESTTGIIVGENTFGKGVVQMIYNFGEDIKFKLTVKEYFSPKGNKINGIGIKPHIEVIIPSFIPENNKRLELNDEDELVKQVEDILLYLGYLTESDNRYSEETVEAIKTFQSDNGLIVNGITDFDTMTKLNEVLLSDTVTNDPQMDMAKKVMYNMIY